MTNDFTRNVHLQWFAEGDQSGEGSEEGEQTVGTEQLQQLLSSEEGKKVLMNTAKSLGLKTPEEVEQEVKGLKNNREEWKKQAMEAKEASEQVKALRSVLSEYGVGVDDEGNISQDDLAEFIHKAKNPEQSDKDVQIEQQFRKTKRDLDAKHKELEKKQKEMGEFQKTLEERDNFISNLLIDGELKAALNEQGYSPQVIQTMIPYLKTASKAAVQVDEESGDRKAVADDGRSLREWVQWWKDTDEGKALRMGPANNGGSAGGSSGGEGSSKKPKNFQQMFEGMFK